jgi:CHAT domain-containing protein
VQHGTTDAIANAEVRATVRSGFTFEPLPASRREVEGIARLFPRHTVAYVGEAATEERAKSVGAVRYLHFATHAVVNEQSPLDSALVLTVPQRPREGQDNGLLQAWEIFERMHLDAGLVTLSACDTALGKEAGGEGLLGLTRAFEYAGAASVVASLWKVADESTAELMTSFYRNLKAGQSKDAALRAAQIDLIRSGRSRGQAHRPSSDADFSHPYHWAAFTLSGDWK